VSNLQGKKKSSGLLMLDMSLSGFDVVHGEQDILTDSRQLLDLSFTAWQTV